MQLEEVSEAYANIYAIQINIIVCIPFKLGKVTATDFELAMIE